MSNYRVEAPHFVAGLSTETHNGSEIVVKAAPILSWAKGKTMTEFLRYCLRKRWAVEAERKSAEDHLRCPCCDGSGRYPSEQYACELCNGRGVVEPYVIEWWNEETERKRVK